MSKHESFLSLTGKSDEYSSANDRLFRSKGVDPILSSISPPKSSSGTTISTIAESIAKSLLESDSGKNESSDEYSEEEEINQKESVDKNEIKKENEISQADKNIQDTSEKQEFIESSIDVNEKNDINFKLEKNVSNDSSSYEYFEEEEEIDEKKVLFQKIEREQEKEKEKRKREEEEEKEIKEKINLLNIEIIQPNQDYNKSMSSEDFNDKDSFTSKYEIIETEPETEKIKINAENIEIGQEKIEINSENVEDEKTKTGNLSIDLKPKNLLSTIRHSTDSLSSSSSVSPISSPIKNSNKKAKPKQQHHSIFDYTSPTRYNLKTPDSRLSKKSPKQKKKAITNVAEINDRETFRDYINGKLDSNKPQKDNYLYFMIHRKRYDSYLSHQEVVEICERLLSAPPGKKNNLDNPGDISLIIEELKRMKVESITNSDYSRGKKIEDLINSLRIQYRTLDREMFHKASLKTLEKKLDDIKSQIVEMNGKIKEEDYQENEKFKANLAELGVKHQNQLQDLEDSWRGPQKMRKYNKRSSTLLNGQYIERNLALIGEYDEANVVHQINKRNEKIESRRKHQVLNSSFENARSTMISEQGKEKERVINLQQDEKKYKKVLQKKNLEVLQKRKSVLEIQMADESNIDNFIAKKFKKDKSNVLPISVALTISDELVPTSPGTARDIENLNNFIAKPITSPLPLPPLTISQLKKQKKKSTVK